MLFKSYRMNKNLRPAAAQAAAVAYEPVQNIKSPPVYRDDLIRMQTMEHQYTWYRSFLWTPRKWKNRKGEGNIRSTWPPNQPKEKSTELILGGDFYAKIKIDHINQNESRNGKIPQDTINKNELVTATTRANKGQWTKQELNNPEKTLNSRLYFDYKMHKKQHKRYNDWRGRSLQN